MKTVPVIYFSLILTAFLSVSSHSQAAPPEKEIPAGKVSTSTNPAPREASASTNEISLFDGKTLKGWAITSFGGQGEVLVENGELRIYMGADLSGINWTNGGLPRINYEIELDAMKLDGNDFFCGLTFPVKDSFCTLICGGWGGSVFGLSSLDGMDASENETSKNLYFEKKRWFHIKLRVLEDKIQTWLDDKKLIDVETKDRKIALRAGGIESSVPLGISTWQTSSAVKNIKLRKL